MIDKTKEVTLVVTHKSLNGGITTTYSVLIDDSDTWRKRLEDYIKILIKETYMIDVEDVQKWANDLSEQDLDDYY